MPFFSGENRTEVNIAQALNSIAAALTERNSIEERKLRVFENLLTVYAAKNGIAMTEAHNMDWCKNLSIINKKWQVKPKNIFHKQRKVPQLYLIMAWFHWIDFHILKTKTICVTITY